MHLPIYEPWEADEAIEEMRGILSPNRECLSLLDSVVSLFGSDIVFGNSIEEQSRFWFDIYSSPVVLEIALANSDRRTEALSHELLHAQLMVNGFPWLAAGQHWSVHRFHGIAPNLICHLAMAPLFAKLGLNQRNFCLAPRRNDIGSMLLETDYDSSFWSGEWCASWFNWLETGYDDSRIYAEEIIHRLRNTRFADLERVAYGVVKWLEQGTFYDPASFEDSYDEFSRIIDIPLEPRDHWFRLNPSRDGAVVRWNANGQQASR